MAGERPDPAPRRLQLAGDDRSGVAERSGHHVEVAGHHRSSSAATSAVRTWPRGASSVAAAYASPRVGPWLTITTGTGDLRRVPHVPKARHHGQRGPQDHQRAGPFDHRVAGLDPRPGHVLTEEHHVGLEHSVTQSAVDDPEGLGRVIGEHRVPVRIDQRRRPRVPAGVGRREPAVQVRARRSLPARQADDPVQAAVQFGHLGRARRLVQPVDVLGDDPGQQPAAAELGHRVVAAVRDRLADVPPAQVAASPVPAPGVRAGGEGLVGHRRRPPGQAGRSAVIGDAGLGGQPGSAQDQHVPGGDDVQEHAERPCRPRLRQLGHESMVPHPAEQPVRCSAAG